MRAHRHDEPIDETDGPARHIEVTVGDRVERPRIEGDARHGRGLPRPETDGKRDRIADVDWFNAAGHDFVPFEPFGLLARLLDRSEETALPENCEDRAMVGVFVARWRLSPARKTLVALAAGVVVVIGGLILAPESRQAAASQAQAATFSERFSGSPAVPDCTAKTWPYFGAECLRGPDGSRPGPARVIAIDRIPSGPQTPTR